MFWMRCVAALVAAYLLGAIPCGYLAAKLLKKVDVRQVGSGRTGGSNVLRAAGVVPALLTVLGDFLKGAAAVALARTLAPEVPLIAALAGLAAVAGHNWPVFLGFKGGVGSMTTLGAAIMLIPSSAAAAMLAGALVLVIWRYSSLASLTLATTLTLTCLLGAVRGIWPFAYLVFPLATGLMSVWELRPNITRLRRGTERKLGQFIKPGQADVSSKDR